MIELIAMCAPDVAPQTVQQIIQVESGGNDLAINVNSLPAAQQPKANTKEEAVTLARRYIEAGYSVDMGLMQVNSGNLQWLGIGMDELEALFTPCANITAGAAILSESYQRAAGKYGPGQNALRAALSAYNTGSFSAGFSNGYVARYYAQHTNQVDSAAAMRAPTAINWNPPAGYYPAEQSTPNQEGEHMEKENMDAVPSKDELDSIDATKRKTDLMGVVPGLGVEVDPDEADRLGAFEETAMSLEDAQDASMDDLEAE